nr:hypothetical protein Iba_scaffold276292CG0010 [Ipomoea batatas]GME00825.1 hypothetical protein Iba_scaffold470665CG0010 [Ipomoea batatas]
MGRSNRMRAADTKAVGCRLCGRPDEGVCRCLSKDELATVAETRNCRSFDHSIGYTFQPLCMKTDQTWHISWCCEASRGGN